MPSATVPGQYPKIGTILDPPSFRWTLTFKGSVQRKLRWVKNGVNRSIVTLDCGAGHSFVVLFRFHLGFVIFPFPVSTVQIMSEFWINRWSGASNVAPILLALQSCHSCYYWRCVAFGANRRRGGTLATRISKPGQICSANKKFLFFMFAALRLLVEHESQDQ